MGGRVKPGHDDFLSPAPRCIDGRDIDFRHVHHRLECALRFLTACRHRLGQRARRDLPVDAPFVLAPSAGALPPAIADNRVPIAIGFFLVVGGDLKRERFALFERRPAIEPDTGNSCDRESTTSTSPFLPDG